MRREWLQKANHERLERTRKKNKAAFSCWFVSFVVFILAATIT